MEDKSRIEAFRKRLYGAEEQRVNWQFWIGSPTAWIALILSAVTAFYTFLYHSDELSVVVGRPSIFLTMDGDIEVRAPSSITFINSGSRPVAVTGIQMMLVQPTEKVAEPKCRNSGAYQYFSVTFEQTVIKPYDTVAKAIKFDETQSSLDTKRVVMSEANKKLKRDQIVVACLEFEIVAADTAGWRKVVQVERVTLSGVGSTDLSVQDARPLYLIKRNRFWTSVGGDGSTFSR